MTASEDLLGWVFVLREWEPGNAKKALLSLLDRIQVGRGQYVENAAVDYLDGLDVEGFRGLVHLPDNRDLIAGGMPCDVAESISRSLQYKLDGFRRIVKLRAEQNRGWVRTFNKLKHLFLAFPTSERGSIEIWVPTEFKLTSDRATMGRAWLSASADEATRYARDAIVAQAVLHDTLAIILQARFGDEYQPQLWVLEAAQMAPRSEIE